MAVLKDLCVKWASDILCLPTFPVLWGSPNFPWSGRRELCSRMNSVYFGVPSQSLVLRIPSEGGTWVVCLPMEPDEVVQVEEVQLNAELLSDY